MNNDRKGAAMDIREAVRSRHSVRQFKDIPIGEEEQARLRDVIGECNRESGLDIQLICDDPECFDTFLAHYGRFRNAVNYIAVVGDASLDGLDELGGYYGQRIVLEAQMMGLNTCWVAGTYGKGKCRADISGGKKLLCVIAIGYGENEGKKHRSKPMEKLCNVKEDDMPTWFRNGMIAAMMAPTAINQQKFFVELDGEDVRITAKPGHLTRLDLGIVKYNFEAVSGHKCR